MFTLHLIRHAKSSWKDPYLKDHDRPLSSRGNGDIKIMSKKIIEAGGSFQNVYSSTAKRARKTAKGLIRSANGLINDTDKPLIKINKEKTLYEFNFKPLVAWLKEINPEQREITLVGHNPAFTDLNNYLSDKNIENIPTCAYVKLLLDINSWKEIKPECAKQEVFIYPKLFK